MYLPITTVTIVAKFAILQTNMLIIGHRGAAGLARENTVEALQAGVDADADILEFDVRLTKDHIPVVVHDWHMLRTHKNTSIVSSLTLAELDMKTGDEPIATLASVLDAFFGKILLNVELKGRGTAHVVGTLLKEKYIKQPTDWDNVLISSFRGRELRVIRRISDRANMSLLHNQNPFLFIAYHRSLHLTAVGFHRLYTNRLALEIAKKTGLFLYAYTVDRPESAERLVRLGIDGIVTNRPDLLKRSMAQLAD